MPLTTQSRCCRHCAGWCTTGCCWTAAPKSLIEALKTAPAALRWDAARKSLHTATPSHMPPRCCRCRSATTCRTAHRPSSTPTPPVTPRTRTQWLLLAATHPVSGSLCVFPPFQHNYSPAAGRQSHVNRADEAADGTLSGGGTVQDVACPDPRRYVLPPTPLNRSTATLSVVFHVCGFLSLQSHSVCMRQPVIHQALPHAAVLQTRARVWVQHLPGVHSVHHRRVFLPRQTGAFRQGQGAAA